MKRDMELVRKILLFVEKIDNTVRLEPLEIEGYSHDAIDHHTRILIEQGYLREKGGISFSMDGISVGGGAMTYEGHDFLDAARNETIWRKITDQVGSTVGSTSIAVIKSLLEDYAKQRLGLS